MDVLEQTVHIIPLGHEFDRAVSVFDHTHVDRVYILAGHRDSKRPNELNEEQHYFTLKVMKHLQNKGIEAIHVDVNTLDLFSIIQKLAYYIKIEIDSGNRVSVNMSAGGRLSSVASTLVGMMHKVREYYVVADDYSRSEEERKKHGISICTRGRPFYLANLPIPQPQPVSKDVLVYIYKENKAVGSKEILEFLKNEEFEGFKESIHEIKNHDEKRRTQSRQLMKLTKSVLGPLEKEGFIEIEKRGRKLYI